MIILLANVGVGTEPTACLLNNNWYKTTTNGKRDLLHKTNIKKIKKTINLISLSLFAIK